MKTITHLIKRAIRNVQEEVDTLSEVTIDKVYTEAKRIIEEEIGSASTRLALRRKASQFTYFTKGSVYVASNEVEHLAAEVSPLISR